MFRKTDLLTLVLLVCAVPGFPQQEPAPKNEPPPDQSAPGTQSPQVPAPAEPPQSSAPAVPQEQQPAKENPPSPEEVTPPAAKPRPGAHKPSTPAKTSSAAKKSRKKQAGEKSHPVVPQSAPADAGSQAGKVVVKNGGATDGLIQLSPGGSQEQEIHNRENTAQLLATTDENLKRISARQLTPSEQSTLGQIQAYMRQARSASDAGDLDRAHTLAFKAHLLSDDLAKR
jgi:hypothetical protein